MKPKEFWNKENKYTNVVSQERIEKARQGKISIEIITNDNFINEKYLEEFKNKKVLILCGAGGKQGPLLSAFGIDTTILDFSEMMINKDKEVAKLNNLRIKTVLGNATDDVFDDNSFDLILQPVSLTYIDEPSLVFKNVYKWLKPKGKYVYGFTNPWLYIFSDDYKKAKNIIPLKEINHWENGASVFENSHTLEVMINDCLKEGFKMISFHEAQIDNSFKYAKPYSIVEMIKQK